jgi:hypothetical protein
MENLTYVSGVRKVKWDRCAACKDSCADDSIPVLKGSQTLCCPTDALFPKKRGRHGHFMYNGPKFCGKDTKWDGGKCVSTVDADAVLAAVDKSKFCQEETTVAASAAVQALDKSQFCGSDTKLENDKCVSTLDVTLDNEGVVVAAVQALDKSQFCGVRTEFDGERCVSTIGRTVTVFGQCKPHQLKLDSDGSNCDAKCETKLDKYGHPLRPDGSIDADKYWHCPGQNSSMTVDIETGCITQKPVCEPPPSKECTHKEPGTRYAKAHNKYHDQSLENCRTLCERREDCTAFGYEEKRKRCELYTFIENPKSMHGFDTFKCAAPQPPTA